jgi:AraC family transcriptional regulator, activator of mtrCDE
MRAESATENLGGVAMLNALSTALFAITLRLASEVTEPPDGLLALAGNPRLVPALTALFNEPARAWTLPELARRCNMSRATFIRHFQERLGRSASDLLTDIRMTVAANALKTSDMSTGAVAELAGYQSDAAAVVQASNGHHARPADSTSRAGNDCGFSDELQCRLLYTLSRVVCAVWPKRILLPSSATAGRLAYGSPLA